MSHPQQISFCKKIKKLFPDFFQNKLVLDIGSLDINGSNRYLFDNCTYLGIDVADGNNVDFVSLGGKLLLPDESIDTIISTECLEHDMCYQETLINMYRMLKPGGLLLFTCATDGRPEHGTARTTPSCAPLLQEDMQWKNYYKNLNEKSIREVFEVEKLFKSFAFEVNSESHDLYFHAFKTGDYIQRKNLYYSKINLEETLLIKNFEISQRDILIWEQQNQLSQKNVELSERNAEIDEIRNIIKSQHMASRNIFQRILSNIPILNKKAINTLDKSNFFDADWYLSKYLDVKKSGLDPRMHYLQYGASECRDPSPNFSTKNYFIANPHLIKSSTNPLIHFEKCKKQSKIPNECL